MFYNDLSCAHCPVHSLQVGELVLCKFELPGCQDMFTVGSCSGCTVHTTTPGHCTARYNAPFPTAPTLSLAGQGVAAMNQGPSAMGAYDSGDGDALNFNFNKIQVSNCVNRSILNLIKILKFLSPQAPVAEEERSDEVNQHWL